MDAYATTHGGGVMGGLQSPLASLVRVTLRAVWGSNTSLRS